MPKQKGGDQTRPSQETWPRNWRDETQYPKFKETGSGQWAWEFLRRNPEFQATWNHYKKSGDKPASKELRRRFGVNNVCDPATEWRCGLVELGADAAMPHVCDPATEWPCGVWIPTTETSSSLLAFDTFPYLEYVGAGEKKACLNGHGMTPREFRRATEPQCIEEVVIKFNLLDNIESQLVQANLLLQIHRKLVKLQYELAASPKAKLFSVERKREQYVLYLRLIDAETEMEIKDDNRLLKEI